MRSLVAAIRFLTRIPLPFRETGVAELPWAVGWFPLVGAAIGAAVAVAFLFVSRYLGSSVAAVLAVATGLLLTGGLHEDGLADALDGLGGGRYKEQVLQIMRDSRIGVYGAMGLWCVLTLRWASLGELQGKSLFALPCALAWGRWAMALMLYALPSASPGLASGFRGARSAPFSMATGWLLIGNVVAWVIGIQALWQPAVAAMVVTLAWIVYVRRRVGGCTGDLLGAGSQLVEAAVLVVVMVR